MIATADFETTTDVNDCRVWAWAICEVGRPSHFKYGNSLDEFMNSFCADKYENHTFYFHNLRFDGDFIFYWLFRNKFKHVQAKDEIADKTFTTLISDKGQFYSIEIYFKKRGKKVNKVTLYDSLKLLNFSVDKIAKGFDLPIMKLEMDYKAFRPVNHKFTTEEVDYIRNDVEIMARALQIMFDKDLTKMTIGSNALEEYKNVIGKKQFNKYFPVCEYDKDIRESYKGGWTYLSDKYKNKTIKDGIVLDVNSLYPWVMYVKPLPYGNGVYYEGKYEKDKLYNLYVQKIKCMFEIKEDHLPTIQIKHDPEFVGTEYLKSSRGKDGLIMEVTLTLTNVDLELFFDHYNVYNLTWVHGYKFKSSTTLFKDYIDKWIEVKIQATKDENEAMRTIAKLMLNSLYGKFALNPQVRSKLPVYDPIKDKVSFVYGEYEERKPIYIPVGAFVTAYAREKTIRSCQKEFHRFCYADTDSAHLEGLEYPKSFEIDNTKLGAWKVEFIFDKAKYVRQKCYMERGYDPTKKEKIVKTKITCAGMPDKCYPHVTFDNFRIGAVYKGKLQTTRVSGGIVLTDNVFSIKKAIL